MMLFRDTRHVPADLGPSVVAIGKFDGLHAGHRALVDRMLADARAIGARSVAVTFDRNPLALIAPARCPRPLVGVEQKIDLLGDTGIDATLLLAFDEKLAAEDAEAFVERVLVGALRARRVLVGRDFRFGRGGAGDAELLRRLGEVHGFSVEVMPDVASEADDRRVSSSWIRELLDAGDVERAAALLGRPHAMRGEIVHGLKRGRELGFPTANLSQDAEGFIPADGVYAGWLVVDETSYPAAISVGTNPTFDDVSRRQVEAYVLDEHDLDLYGRHAEVRFVSRIRGMVAFEGVEKLIAQMTEDVARTRDVLRTG